MWLDHATLADSDFEWLCDVERLTLWNVTIPRDFLGRLKNLWWLDWRGGGLGQGIDQIAPILSTVLIAVLTLPITSIFFVHQEQVLLSR